MVQCCMQRKLVGCTIACSMMLHALCIHHKAVRTVSLQTCSRCPLDTRALRPPDLLLCLSTFPAAFCQVPSLCSHQSCGPRLLQARTLKQLRDSGARTRDIRAGECEWEGREEEDTLCG